MKRNENANCGNCPYWLLSIPEDNIGECHRDNPRAVDPYRRWETTNIKEWCGQHPDFWEPVEITETIPSVWPNKYPEGQDLIEFAQRLGEVQTVGKKHKRSNLTPAQRLRAAQERLARAGL